MLKIEDVFLFKNGLLYLSNLSYYQFDGIAMDIWGDRGDHMLNKFWKEKGENIWAFFVCLDDISVAKLVEWMNENADELQGF